MSLKLKAAILISSSAVLLFMVVGGLDGVRASSNDGAYRQLQVYSEVLSRVQGDYVESPNIPAVTDGALHGLLESLDSNSSYLSPAEYKIYKAQPKDGAADIGAAVSKRFGYATVVAVIPGSSAEKAGLTSGDIIEAIEGRSTRDMSLAEIRNLLSGAPGSNVTVSVVRARKAQPDKMTITREVTVIPPVSDKLVEDGIGVIQVDALNKGKAQEIANKIKQVEKQGAKKLILDLRNCAEGDEAEGVAVANLFLNHGTIAYVQGQKYPRQAFSADPSKDITNLPLVVLVNKGTAGAAEIVAAAILENARGDVVGDKTFGDGSVQKLLELPDGGALILSIAKYYSPSGKAIQDVSVTPNVLVADAEDNVPTDSDGNPVESNDQEKKAEPQKDDQMQKAIEVLKSHNG
ncbi:MAG TPA: S41 family peptidase [Terriglobales bacterium]